MTRYFNNKNTCEEEVLKQIAGQYGGTWHPRMGAHSHKEGNKFYISIHSHPCICGNCPTLQVDGSIGKHTPK